LVEGKGETDVYLHSPVLDYYKFEQKSGEALHHSSVGERKAYYEQERIVLAKAKTENVFNNDFYYWRKFHQLQGWMEALYYAKGGASETFNCVTVRLTLDDLDKLAEDAKKGLPDTVGFFFGNGDWNKEAEEDVLDFVAKAKLAINLGMAVFYDSWW
jgi:hypothetical protein